jgi:hypothetical protein
VLAKASPKLPPILTVHTGNNQYQKLPNKPEMTLGQVRDILVKKLKIEPSEHHFEPISKLHSCDLNETLGNLQISEIRYLPNAKPKAPRSEEERILLEIDNASR